MEIVHGKHGMPVFLTVCSRDIGSGFLIRISLANCTEDRIRMTTPTKRTDSFAWR
jgi:hypothetical protein